MANTSFENAIRSYLEDRAKADSLFAETYKKEGKSRNAVTTLSAKRESKAEAR